MSKLARLEKKLLHYVGQAVEHYNLIQAGDRIVVGFSGGKDSFALFWLLKLLQERAKINFDLQVVNVDHGYPCAGRLVLTDWMKLHNVIYVSLPSDIGKIVKQKARNKASPCILCSRIRRGILYSFAKKNNYNKIALGHHREDIASSFLMSVFYNGRLASMPPKLLTNDGQLVVVRPLIYCQVQDIVEYVRLKQFPITKEQCPLGEKEGSRWQMEKLIGQLTELNGKIPANLMRALQNVRGSHLLDKNLWDFKNLEKSVVKRD